MRRKAVKKKGQTEKKREGRQTLEEVSASLSDDTDSDAHADGDESGITESAALVISHLLSISKAHSANKQTSKKTKQNN